MTGLFSSQVCYHQIGKAGHETWQDTTSPQSGHTNDLVGDFLPYLVNIPANYILFSIVPLGLYTWPSDLIVFGDNQTSEVPPPPAHTPLTPPPPPPAQSLPTILPPETTVELCKSKESEVRHSRAKN